MKIHITRIISISLIGVLLAMGVSVIIRTILTDIDTRSLAVMLGIGLTCLSVNLLMHIEKTKKWMYRFNGVATKYINNYIYWFRWLQLFENDNEAVKIKNLI